MRLLADHMPEYDRRAGHTAFVRAEPATVVRSIERANLATSGVLRALFERSALARPVHGCGVTFTGLGDLGCVLFRSARDDERAVGAMWLPAERGLERIDATVQTFGSRSSSATHVFVHFGVAPAGAAKALLSIETRLWSSGEAGAARALALWDALRRLGAAARRDVLLSIKELAESRAGRET